MRYSLNNIRQTDDALNETHVFVINEYSCETTSRSFLQFTDTSHKDTSQLYS